MVDVVKSVDEIVTEITCGANVMVVGFAVLVDVTVLVM